MAHLPSPPTSFTSLINNEVVLDNVLKYLNGKDLRAFHRVNRACRRGVESRGAVNTRRVQFVQGLTDNKENDKTRAINNKEPEAVEVPVDAGRDTTTDVSRLHRMGAKPGATTLMDCQNSLSVTTPTNNNTKDKDKFVTPETRFPFQIFQEAEKSLKKGEMLVSCLRCRGPVVSPSTKTPIHGNDCSCKKKGTRCRLTYNMEEREVSTSDTQVCKRAKSDEQSSMISITSPTSSLGEKFVDSLVMSDTTTATTSTPVTARNTNGNGRNTGIDLPSSNCNTTSSSLDCQLSFTSPGFGDRNNSFRNITDSPLRNDCNPEVHLFRNGVFRNVVLSPDQTGSSPTVSKSESSKKEEDCKKTDTLNSDSHDINANLLPVQISNETHTLKELEAVISHDGDSGIANSVGMETDSSSQEDSQALREEGTCANRTTTVQQAESSNSKSISGYFSESEEVLRALTATNIQQSPVQIASTSNSASAETPSNNESVSVDVNDILLDSPCPQHGFVLQCPNANCGFRFCQNCRTSEHPGTPCRLITTESLEEDTSYTSFGTSNSKPISKERNKSKTKEGKGKTSRKPKLSAVKKSLLRLARL